MHFTILLYRIFMCILEYINGRHAYGSVHRDLSYEEKIERLQILWNLWNICDQVERDDTIFSSKKVFLHFHKEVESLEVRLWNWKFRCIVDGSLERLTQANRIDKNETKLSWFQQPHFINTHAQCTWQDVWTCFIDGNLSGMRFCLIRAKRISTH